MSDPWRIESEEQIAELIGAPSDVVRQKIFDHVDEHAADFIAHSPLMLMATSDAEGRVEVSPKGDAAGFVACEGERTLLIPERPGNKLAFGFRNILANPRVGLIFLVPGTTETLRIGGRAELTRDPALLEKLAARGKAALLVTRVTVDECFFHCGKAFLRSSLWKSETWPAGYRVSFGRQLARRMGGGDELATAIDESIAEGYLTRLY
jgi:PPOX class probable FMN-dependent enzyme